MFPNTLLGKTTGLGETSGSAAVQDAHAAEPRGLCPDPQPQLPGAVWGAHGEHPEYGPPRAAGVMGCGEGDFQPPSCTSLSRIPDASGQREEGNGSRERTQGQMARGGEGKGGGEEGRKGVPHTGGESLFIHPPFPLSTRQPQRQPLIRIFMNTRTNGRLRGGKKKKHTPTTTQPYFAHSLSSKSRCAVACKPRRTLPCC